MLRWSVSSSAHRRRRPWFPKGLLFGQFCTLLNELGPTHCNCISSSCINRFFSSSLWISVHTMTVCLLADVGFKSAPKAIQWFPLCNWVLPEGNKSRPFNVGFQPFFPLFSQISLGSTLFYILQIIKGNNGFRVLLKTYCPLSKLRRICSPVSWLQVQMKCMFQKTTCLNFINFI